MGTKSAILFVFVISVAGAYTESVDSALLYLSQYGYIPKSRFNSSMIMDEDKFTNAIAEFQSFAGLNITGLLDNETITTMSLPRCGIRDKVGTGSDSRSRRYALQGSRWKVKELNYKISKYPKNLNKKDVDKELQRAFDIWSDYTDLSFTPSIARVHIDIRFENGEHGDGDPFDGPGGTLAHAYFPVYGGDAHFDAAETWTINSYKGTNLFQVAAHEFGHSLGLSHSDVRSALMAPFYRGYEPYFNLDRDDIEGIQALYGKRTKKPSGPPASGGGDEDDDDDEDNNDDDNAVDSALCKDSKFNTIFETPEGETILFKGRNYWQLSDDKIMPGFPKPINTRWAGLPGDVDAAFTYKNGKTYFFKGKKYWRYVGKKMDGDYPKDISVGFAGIPDDIDAATVWSGNGKIYFYKGSKFWRFDPTQRPPVKGSYPKPISNWEGLPNNVDAAHKDSNGYTYFFKDGMYYRFNDRQFAVDEGNPGFPRSTAHWWFGCKEAPRGTIGTKRGFLGSLTSEGSDSGRVRDADPNFETDVYHKTNETHLPDSGSHRLAASLVITAVVTLLTQFTS